MTRVPDLGELIGGVVRFVGETIGASRLTLGIGPTLAVLGVLLVLLYLLARPAGRWSSRDLGRLQGVGRTMAVAAESGGTASFSLGTAGVARPASATDRMQTLAALRVLSHVAAAAARSGVPLEVTANDSIAIEMARGVIADAFATTSTSERARRARAEHVGEGRPSAAARSLARHPVGGGTAHVVGGLSEEALLLLTGESRASGVSSFGTATPSQAVWVMLLGGGTLIGPEIYNAGTVASASTTERAGSFTANRLIWLAIAIMVAGSVLALTGVFDAAGFVVGRS